MATNGFMPEGLHPAFDARVVPALSNIVTTRPLTDAELAAQRWKTENPICNTRDMLFYYRLLPDKRLLFGARGDTTGRPQDTAKMRAWLIRGLVCVTLKLTPAIGRLEDDPTVCYGFGYHANGVNPAPWAGRELARLIAGSNTGKPDLPAIVSGLPRRIPFAALRLWGLRAAYLYYRMQDDRG